MLYNPHILSRQELIETFVARQPLLDELLDDLRRGGAQHHLLVGDRGTGKTTLLLRLAAAIEDDEQLATTTIPLRFPEEQYNVSRPSDFWLNAIDALIDALERHGDRVAAKRLESSLDELEPLDEDDRAQRALAILEGWAKRARCVVVLLIDNLDLVLTRLAASLWELREALSIDNSVVVIGGSSTFIHQAIDYQSPFYDFFRVHELSPLSEDEARRVVLSLARRANTPRVAEVLEQDPGRFRALYALTGGTPRTLALLHTVLALDHGDRIERDLDGLLDQLTPYYKARFDDLAPQSQVIVDAVALHWHPITATECQSATRIDLNTVSAQLSRLVKSGVLAKVSLPGSKLGFQLGERFFNIWYLMRASRRLRRRLSWFVEFLRMFYGEEDLRQRAEELVRETLPDRLNSPAKFLAFASAVPDEALRRRLEFRAIELLMSEGLAAAREVMDLEGEDMHMVPVVDRVRALRDIRARIVNAKVHWPVGQTASSVAELIVRAPMKSLASKQRLADDLIQGVTTRTEALVRRTHDSSTFGDHLLNAIATGEVPSLCDVRTPAELHQIIELSESRLRVILLLLIATEGSGGSLPDETLRQLLSLDPSAAEMVVTTSIVFLDQLDWARVRHLVLLVTRPAATSIDLATWMTFLRRCLSARRGAEALDLIVDAGIAERWAPLYEALRAAVDDSRARLDALAPEMRVAASALFDQLRRPDRSRAGDATGTTTENPRSGERKPGTRRASPIQATKRTKQATRRRTAKQRRDHRAGSAD
jgi:hypothetical protein